MLNGTQTYADMPSSPLPAHRYAYLNLEGAIALLDERDKTIAQQARRISELEDIPTAPLGNLPFDSANFRKPETIPGWEVAYEAQGKLLQNVQKRLGDLTAWIKRHDVKPVDKVVYACVLDYLNVWWGEGTENDNLIRVKDKRALPNDFYERTGASQAICADSLNRLSMSKDEHYNLIYDQRILAGDDPDLAEAAAKIARSAHQPILQRDIHRGTRKATPDELKAGKQAEQPRTWYEYKAPDAGLHGVVLSSANKTPAPTTLSKRKIQDAVRVQLKTQEQRQDAQSWRVHITLCPTCGADAPIGIKAVCRQCGEHLDITHAERMNETRPPSPSAPKSPRSAKKACHTEGPGPMPEAMGRSFAESESDPLEVPQDPIIPPGGRSFAESACSRTECSATFSQSTPAPLETEQGGVVCGIRNHRLSNYSTTLLAEDGEVDDGIELVELPNKRGAFAESESDLPQGGIGEEIGMNASLLAEALPLVDNRTDLAHVLGMATQVLMSVVGVTTSYGVMQSRQTNSKAKYLTEHSPVTSSLLAGHLVGNATITVLLMRPDPASDGSHMTRAVAYDYDENCHRLITASKKLVAQGFMPLLIRNDAKRASGHLWFIFDRDVCVERAFAALDLLAPELSECPEKYPNVKVKDGGKLRLPGGMYHPVGLNPVPVAVGLVGDDGPEWFDSLSVEAWDAIRSCVTPASCLDHAWIKPEARVRPKPKVAAPSVPVRRATPAGDTIQDAVDRFKREKGIRDQVRDISRDGMFSSPFHEDKNPSCKLYEDGHWCDFSAKERHRFDALDYYCAGAGLWTDQERRTDPDVRVKVLRDLGYLQTPEKRPDVLSVKLEDVADIGEKTVVRIVAADRAKWEAATASFKAACKGAWFNGVEKRWELDASRYQEAKAWQLAYAGKS